VTPGALQPAIGDSQLATEFYVIVGNPDGQPGRPTPVAILTIQVIGALAGVKQRRGVTQPPTGPTQALKCLGRLLVEQDLLESGLCYFPLCTPQRLMAGQYEAFVIWVIGRVISSHF
jgi:hypothetical protein